MTFDRNSIKLYLVLSHMYNTDQLPGNKEMVKYITIFSNLLITKILFNDITIVRYVQFFFEFNLKYHNGIFNLGNKCCNWDIDTEN